tara:strand:+ start:313 stop:1566 length:1254 start_codon:yes stop_codon:yes gene_type:complete
MTFKEMQEILSEQLDIVHLADIARELSVSPQVINNWKNRNKIPYKYVKIIRNIEKKGSADNEIKDSGYEFLKQLGQVNNSNIQDEDDDIDFKEDLKKIILVAYKLFKEKYKVIISVTFAFMFISTIYVLFFAPIIFQSTVSIIPSGGNNKSNNISGVASQFGINIGSNNQSDIGSTDLIPDLIKSRSLLYSLLNRKFDVYNDGKKIPLLEYLNKEKKDFLINKEVYKRKAAAKLSRMISINKNKKNDILKITVNMDHANLVYEVAMAVVEEIDKVQKRITLSRVKEKLSFISNRMENISIDLVGAEENLKKFRQNNRNILGSPSLLLEEDRLKRELISLERVYTTLKSQFEITRIEEIGSSKLIMILDEPEIPIMRLSPKRKSSVMTAGFFGFFISIFLTYFSSFIIDIYRDIRKRH